MEPVKKLGHFVRESGVVNVSGEGVHLIGKSSASGSGEVLLRCDEHVVEVCDVRDRHYRRGTITDHVLGLNVLLEFTLVDLDAELTREVFRHDVGEHGRTRSVEESGVGCERVERMGCDLGEPRGHGGISAGEGRTDELRERVVLFLGSVDRRLSDVGEHSGVNG